MLFKDKIKTKLKNLGKKSIEEGLKECVKPIPVSTHLSLSYLKILVELNKNNPNSLTDLVVQIIERINNLQQEMQPEEKPKYETFTKPIAIPKRNTGYNDNPYFLGSQNELRRQIKLN